MTDETPTTASAAPTDQPPRPRTDRTRIRRHADRAVPDRIEEFLREGLIAHLAVVQDGEPRLMPFLYHYEAGCLYIHGSLENATLGLVARGLPVSVAITRITDLVASKTAAGHAANYRSVIVFGHGRRIEDSAEKRRVLEAMTERYFPGRRPPTDYEAATERDLAGVGLVEIVIDEASAKLRDLDPNGRHDNEGDFPGTAFRRPVHQ